MPHAPTPGLYGHITHTDLVSRDPAATKAWCEQVFGWTFRSPFQSPAGEYHLFAYSPLGGGGIGKGDPPEKPGSTPFVHVEDAQASFDLAIEAGAVAIQKPERVMEGVTIALVAHRAAWPSGCRARSREEAPRHDRRLARAGR